MTLAPSQTPDAGYMGDRRRGAGHGRADDHEADPQLDWHIWPAGSDKRAQYIAKRRECAAVDQARLDALIGWNEPATMPRVHLVGIRLDSGGYDQGGAYWGTEGGAAELWDCELESVI